MGFLAPLFLGGLLFAAVPLVIHLIYRRRSPQIIFAATRFLKAAVRRTARSRSIDNLLLLVLRTLLFALLALGLAGPVVKRAIAGARAGTDVVIVFDNSLSMSASDDGSVRFTKAKEAVAAILAGLASGDLVAVIATAPPASRAEVGLTSGLADVRTRFERLEVSRARGSLAASIDRAASILEKSAAATKLLYVVTDLQANAFPSKKLFPTRLAPRFFACL